jgi:hypothetical protein
MFRKLQRLSRGRVALSKGDIPKVREGGRDGVAAWPTLSFGKGYVHLTCLRSVYTDT